MDTNTPSDATPTTAHAPAGGYTRRFVFNTFYGVGERFARLGVSLFLIGYVVGRLGTEQWGLIVLATTVTTFLSLIQLGASVGIAKKLNTYLTRGETFRFRQYFTAGMVLCASLSAAMLVALVAVLTLFWDRLNVRAELAWEGRLVLGALGVAAVCTSLSVPFTACLQAVHRIDINAKLQAVALLLRCGLVVLLFELTGPRPSTYAYVLIAASAATLLGLWAWVWKNVPEARFAFRSLTRGLLRDVVAFNALTLFNTLNYVLFMQSPAFVLQAGPGLATVGLYGIGLQLNNMVRSFLVATVNALSPVAVSLESSGRLRELTQLFCVATKAFASIGIMMWVWFLVLGETFLQLWLKGGVSELVHALPWLIGASAIGVLAMPTSVFVVALERLRLPAFGGVVLALAMVGAMFYALGVPQSHLLTTISKLLLCFFAAYQLIRFWTVTSALKLAHWKAVLNLLVRPAMPAAVAGIVLKLADHLGLAGTVVQLIAITVCAGVVFLSVSFVAVFSREERALAGELIGKLRRPPGAAAADQTTA